MTLKYTRIQRLDGGKWVNYSCHFYYSLPRNVFNQYAYFKRKYPGERFRIVKGHKEVQTVFDNL